MNLRLEDMEKGGKEVGMDKLKPQDKTGFWRLEWWGNMVKKEISHDKWANDFINRDFLSILNCFAVI